MFAFLLPVIGGRGLVGKAVIFSLILSFFEEFIVVLFKVPHLVQTTPTTLISTFIGAVLWGWFWLSSCAGGRRRRHEKAG